MLTPCTWLLPNGHRTASLAALFAQQALPAATPVKHETVGMRGAQLQPHPLAASYEAHHVVLGEARRCGHDQP